MTYQVVQNTKARGDLLGRVATFLTSTGARLDQYRVYRRTLTELSHLSDRDLADLGITRSMITSIAYDAAYGTR